MRTHPLSSRPRRIALCALLLCAAPPAAAAGISVTPAGNVQEAVDAAVDPAEDGRHRLCVEGSVLLPDGGPARGAVVVSSAGGSAAVRDDGFFALEIAVDPAALAVELTAVAHGPGGLLIARRELGGLRAGAARHAGTLVLAQSQGCAPDWIPTFGGKPGTNDVVYALTVFDDASGAGPALYAGGDFTIAGAESANRIARWDGESWSALGSGMNAAVVALAVFDDGSGAGPALYAAGDFTTAGGQSAERVAKWDGQAWSALGSGTNDSVRALMAFDDGSGAGPKLYAGGDFTSAGGQSANWIAKWDGQGWSALAGGLSSTDLDHYVRGLTVFDDGAGGGPALYVGGLFTGAGGQAANNIARWDGGSWSALGSGVNNDVRALTGFDDGSGAGPALYAAGFFTMAGGQSASRIARWDGESWSALADGFNSAVNALTVFDDGSGGGPALFAGGHFIEAGDLSVRYIARWDGQGWSALGGGMSNEVYALTVFDDGSGAGPALCAGGQFFFAGDEKTANFIAQWDGGDWSTLGSGIDLPVRALTVFDDGLGAGPALYAGGDFISAGGVTVNSIARWDGQGWSALGAGIDVIGQGNSVRSLAVFDDGSGAGSALYAGGMFTQVDGLNANRIARWDGESWSALGSGVGSGSIDSVNALAVFDDGSGGGPALYAGGSFTIAGGQSANRIARWDGESWSTLGGGMNDEVRALAVFDDGSGAGPALYAAGRFTTAGGASANRIARWNGESWSSLASGMDFQVHALAVFDDGSGAGPALYAGGGFNLAGGVSASRIARWDGESWSALGSGTTHQVFALGVFDDASGAGPALYAGGTFTTAGGVSANRIARWDGETWSPLASGLNEQVWALTVFDDGSGAGPALHAGGLFTVSPGGDSYLARWGCPSIDALPGCFGNPAALTSLSSAASIGSTFEVSLSASQLATGVGLLFFGFDGTDAAGCGLFVPGVGELLLALAPVPLLVGSGPLTAGAVGFPLPVPDQPSAVGVEVALHGVVVGVFDPGLPIELSNALRVTITQ